MHQFYSDMGPVMYSLAKKYNIGRDSLHLQKAKLNMITIVSTKPGRRAYKLQAILLHYHIKPSSNILI